MKKIFVFGKIDFEEAGKKTNLVTVEMEYKEQGNKKTFSARGNVWNNRGTDTICCGQCLDTIAKYINDPVFSKIHRLWKLYHLNDMHPECEHQHALGWHELAKGKAVLYHWCITREVRKKQDSAKRSAISALERGETFTPTEEEAFFASMPYSLVTHEKKLPAETAPFYEPKKPLYPGDNGHTETKHLGWMREDEHPDGILGKACPVCGYKFGSRWNYFPIPSDDEKIIIDLLRG